MTNDRNNPWAEEFRAMLALAWPLILTNITMVLINATDVFLLARLGPDALAASALGSGIVIAMLLIGIGIVVAASPLMAAELGRKAHSVRDVRRTFRQSLWAATAICVPIWAILVADGLVARMGRAAAATGGRCRTLHSRIDVANLASAWRGCNPQFHGRA